MLREVAVLYRSIRRKLSRWRSWRRVSGALGDSGVRARVLLYRGRLYVEVKSGGEEWSCSSSFRLEARQFLQTFAKISTSL